MTESFPLSALLSCVGWLHFLAGWLLPVAKVAPGSSSLHPVVSTPLAKEESPDDSQGATIGIEERMGTGQVGATGMVVDLRGHVLC